MPDNVNTDKKDIEIITGSGKANKTINIYNSKNIIKVANALLIEYKDNSIKIIQNFNTSEDVCHKKDKINFKDYIKNFPDKTQILLKFVYDKSKLKDNDIILLNNKFTFVKDVDLNKINSRLLFNDDSCVAYLPFDGDVKDQKGNFTPNVYGTAPKYIDGKFGQAILSQYTGDGSFEDTSATQVKIGVVNKDSNIVTISAWLKWNKIDRTMPFGFDSYNLCFYNNWIGFNTSNGDIYGIDNKLNWTEFHHFVAEFHEGEYGKLWIDGVEQELTQKAEIIDKSKAKIKNINFYIFGWDVNKGHRNFGAVDEVFIFNRALTNDEIQNLYKGKYFLRKLNI